MSNSASAPANAIDDPHNGLVSRTTPQFALWSVTGIAAAITILHLLTNSRYGFHRDELQFLSDARHLDWGFVVYPPVTPSIGRVSLACFGPSLVLLRLFSDLAQAAAILLTGLMAREFGGKRLAQIIAATSVALSPISLHYGTEFIYSSFDYLWWVLTAYMVIRLLNSPNAHSGARWWLLIGVALGVGLMTKYTIAALIGGILAGLVLTSARAFFRSKWFWIGICLTALVVTPNIIWQFRHNFISLHWMHAIHIRDLGLGRDKGYFAGQFLLDNNLVATPLCLIGLVCCFRLPAFRRFRPVGWMYLVPVILLLLAKARFYYPAPAYPMLLAIGAAQAEIWLGRLKPSHQPALKWTYFALLGTYALISAISIIPFASAGPLRRFALNSNWDLREEIGWTDLVEIVARIRNTLPPDTSTGGVGILVGNYGEAGAFELFGPAYHLPPPISGTNSAWLRGYPQPAPSKLIVVGLTQTAAEGWFFDCRAAGTVTNTEGIHNLEVDPIRSTIMVCGPPRQPWPVFWEQFKSFG